MYVREKQEGHQNSPKWLPDNMNLRHLELYSVMAEHDNTGFHLSYCLLSTATAIDLGKQTKVLTAWAKCPKDKYGMNPKFVHVDKDMAEIRRARDVWNANISLCWWHLQQAVHTHLTNGKLSTTPYNVGCAHAEFPFVTLNFKPKGKADPKEFEGRVHANADNSKQASATTTIAQLSWLWEYKRKQKKISKKEREKGGISQLTRTLSICKIFRKSPENVLIVIPLFHHTFDGEK